MFGTGVAKAIDRFIFPGTIAGINYIRKSLISTLPLTMQQDTNTPSSPNATQADASDTPDLFSGPRPATYVLAPEATQEADDASVIARAETTIKAAIALGRSGRFSVVPEYFSISATNNCNLRCIMCPGHSGMTGPRLSLADAENLFASLGSNRADFGKARHLDMTAGEPTLNRDLHLIFAKFKEAVPSGKISIISNATLPVRGRVKEVFELADNIGLSIDGATKETYERIRKGSNFENVIRNIEDIADLTNFGQSREDLSILFVVMDQNAHELPELVRLAHRVGVPRVFAQAVEVRTLPFLDGENIDFNTSPAELRGYVEAAFAEAARLNVNFAPTEGLLARCRDSVAISSSPIADQIVPAVAVAPDVSFAEGIKLCNVPWVNAPRYVHENSGKMVVSTVCCHMPQVAENNLGHDMPEINDLSINDLFNSSYYWGIREGLLDGSLAVGACKGCQYYKTTQWTPAQLRALERSVPLRDLQQAP